MGAHIIDGKFQSDKYPTCPAGKVPLSVEDPTAQDLLWEYAERRRQVDAEFSDDLEAALRTAGLSRERQHFAATRWIVGLHGLKHMHRENTDFIGRLAEALMQAEGVLGGLGGKEPTQDQREEYADAMLEVASLAFAQFCMTALQMPDKADAAPVEP